MPDPSTSLLASMTSSGVPVSFHQPSTNPRSSLPFSNIPDGRSVSIMPKTDGVKRYTPMTAKSDYEFAGFSAIL